MLARQNMGMIACLILRISTMEEGRKKTINIRRLMVKISMTFILLTLAASLRCPRSFQDTMVVATTLIPSMMNTSPDCT